MDKFEPSQSGPALTGAQAISSKTLRGGTHALACGVLDRDSNETKYLREATELIEAWQRQLQGGHSVNHSSGDRGEVVLLKCQR